MSQPDSQGALTLASIREAQGSNYERKRSAPVSDKDQYTF